MIQVEAVQAAVRQRFGAELAKIERWSDFRENETQTEWVQFLGPTAVVLTHQEHMVRVVEKLLKNDPTITENDKQLFALAFAIHDVGEMTVGDTPNPNKTASSDQEEWTAAIHSLELLAKDLEDGSQLIEIYREIVAGGNVVLYELFKAIERTEYFMTGMQGFRYLQESGDTAPNKWLLVARVLAFDLPIVLSLATKYPHSIGEFLRAESDIISEMLVETSPKVTDDFRAKYEETRTEWTSFQSSQL